MLDLLHKPLRGGIPCLPLLYVLTISTQKFVSSNSKHLKDIAAVSEMIVKLHKWNLSNNKKKKRVICVPFTIYSF